MIRIYLKQAWELLRQNRLFSTIYIIGTGMAIALTMTMFIIFYVKLAPIYPEYNRDRMVVLKAVKCYPKDKPENYNAGALSDEVAEMLDSLPHLDRMATTSRADMFSFVGLPGQKQVFNVRPLFVSEGFWDVFTFRFVQGQPFTREDVEAKERIAILSESTARRLFASTDVVGQRFLFKGMDYRCRVSFATCRPLRPCRRLTCGCLRRCPPMPRCASRTNCWALGPTTSRLRPQVTRRR